MLKLLAFVLPLGLDSFAVAAALGASQAISARQRLRISLVSVLFEGGMPLIGLGLGTALARGIGQAAGYLAGAAVIAIGGWMVLAGDKDEEDKVSHITTSRGVALIAVGLSISLDELAIGFTIGLAHLPVTAVILAIALHAPFGLPADSWVWTGRNGQLAGRNELGGNCSEFRVLSLRYARQVAEGGVGSDAVPLHQDALGLTDDVAVDKCGGELVSALRLRERERRERGEQARDAPVKVGEGRGLVGVEAERSQASLIDR